MVGRAIEEWTVFVSSELKGIDRMGLRTREDVSGNKTLVFGLPRARADRFTVRIHPTFLPFVKIKNLRAYTEEYPASMPEPAPNAAP